MRERKNAVAIAMNNRNASQLDTIANDIAKIAIFTSTFDSPYDAIAYAKENNIHTVCVDEFYTISSSIILPENIHLKGKDLSCGFKQADNTNLNTIITNELNETWGKGNIEVSNLFVDCNWRGQDQNGTPTYGVHFSFGKSDIGYTVDNISVHDNYVYDSVIGIGVQNKAYSPNARYENVNIFKNKIEIGANKAIELQGANNSTIKDNLVVQCQAGPQLIFYCDDCVISNNICVDMTDTGINIAHSIKRATIIGNTVDSVRNCLSFRGDGLTVDNDIEDIVVTGNVFNSSFVGSNDGYNSAIGFWGHPSVIQDNKFKNIMINDNKINGQVSISIPSSSLALQKANISDVMFSNNMINVENNNGIIIGIPYGDAVNTVNNIIIDSNYIIGDDSSDAINVINNGDNIVIKGNTARNVNNLVNDAGFTGIIYDSSNILL